MKRATLNRGAMEGHSLGCKPQETKQTNRQSRGAATENETV
jgi:hypothetical protein